MKFLVILSIALAATVTSAAPQYPHNNYMGSSGTCRIPGGLVSLYMADILPPMLHVLGENNEDSAVQLLIENQERIICGLLSQSPGKSSTIGNQIGMMKLSRPIQTE